jgi:hypothetical protein
LHSERNSALASGACDRTRTPASPDHAPRIAGGLEPIKRGKDAIDIGVVENHPRITRREDVRRTELLHPLSGERAPNGSRLLVRDRDVPATAGIGECLHHDGEIYRSDTESDVHGVESGGTKSRVLEER